MSNKSAIDLLSVRGTVFLLLIPIAMTVLFVYEIYKSPEFSFIKHYHLVLGVATILLLYYYEKYSQHTIQFIDNPDYSSVLNKLVSNFENRKSRYYKVSKVAFGWTFPVIILFTALFAISNQKSQSSPYIYPSLFFASSLLGMLAVYISGFLPLLALNYHDIAVEQQKLSKQKPKNEHRVSTECAIVVDGLTRAFSVVSHALINILCLHALQSLEHKEQNSFDFSHAGLLSCGMLVGSYCFSLIASLSLRSNHVQYTTQKDYSHVAECKLLPRGIDLCSRYMFSSQVFVLVGMKLDISMLLLEIELIGVLGLLLYSAYEDYSSQSQKHQMSNFYMPTLLSYIMLTLRLNNVGFSVIIMLVLGSITTYILYASILSRFGPRERRSLEILKASVSGQALSIISIMTNGLQSTAVPVIITGASLLLSYNLGLSISQTDGLASLLYFFRGLSIASLSFRMYSLSKDFKSKQPSEVTEVQAYTQLQSAQILSNFVEDIMHIGTLFAGLFVVIIYEKGDLAVNIFEPEQLIAGVLGSLSAMVFCSKCFSMVQDQFVANGIFKFTIQPQDDKDKIETKEFVLAKSQNLMVFALSSFLLWSVLSLLISKVTNDGHFFHELIVSFTVSAGITGLLFSLMFKGMAASINSSVLSLLNIKNSSKDKDFSVVQYVLTKNKQLQNMLGVAQPLAFAELIISTQILLVGFF